MTAVHNAWLEGRNVVTGELLACSGCGDTEALIAFRPGCEPVHCAGVLVERGVPSAAWCARCWPALRAAA